MICKMREAGTMFLASLSLLSYLGFAPQPRQSQAAISAKP